MAAVTSDAGPGLPAESAGDPGAEELQALASFATAPDDEILAPPDHPVWAAARLLDGLAVLVHGSSTEVSAAARRAFPPSVEGLHAWPDVRSHWRADDTAFLLGVYAFSENFADTGLGSVAHVNSIVVPALLVAVQQQPVTGRQALAALAVGYEVMEWAAASLNGGRPRMAHQLRGFRPTPTAGPLAAVAVLGRLSGLTREEMANALGMACSQGGGLRPTNASPTSAIRIQSGEALRRAVNTIALARAGVTSHPGILRCPGGWFPAYSFSEPGPYRVPVAGSADNLMTRVSMKLECTPHTLVTMLDAARAIAGRRSFGADDVAAVTVRIPAQHDVISGGDKPYPTTFSEAAGHVPYCIALAMTTRSHLFPGVISTGLADEAVRKLTPRVLLEVDDGLSQLFDGDPFSWPAALRVDWSDGTHDDVFLAAPETTTWAAEDALEHAGLKAEVLLGGRGGSRGDLVEEFADVVSWPDLWGGLLRHPLAEAGERGR